ncbi:hypothetical protein [Couchioplanes azureus]|uniref:hypothetical protein n=1 Tax=Couchioplanes caeruleus TaxID=56438 RepID=UPI00166F6C9B|nr:hypothetical protein [Couchioplanes caeruleus]GGQ63426.1 hypothetical protein GCM10010166_36540 [Couchioplanes caeruleus subsp. azureus]
MEALRLVLRYAHLVGFALLLGGAIVQFVSGKLRINPAMLWGAIIQVLTGLALSAPLPRDGDAQPDPARLAVKLVVAILILVMVFVPWRRKREDVNRGHFIGIIAMTLVNAAVATFWR